ncbi:hypothetical protein PICMEDRAFT_95680 [Pichia membranifaciens NRRL Y-2026]|uniref:Uncharacterized protein n=1 Tax=Pichia membranifaciens NRRL Y-2026 TaxID=763406 RepID=A0A1E3NSS3_9ASCO|nr:hypothetical protein PICMEDRAFT_95680 [Pichia membranifaciens NRRL Y-2026]ODQ49122.1 hypothetical protein PICMEDRAFT_95680 [Pichia membranifaciens NRRL Y-2026]
MAFAISEVECSMCIASLNSTAEEPKKKRVWLDDGIITSGKNGNAASRSRRPSEKDNK